MSKIIAFEGIDGLGKTSHIHAVSKFLTTMNIKNIVTQELYGNDIRNQIKAILMDKDHDLDGYDELMLISLARRWHYRKVIQPALDEGILILVDRFVDSTWAYQGGGRQVPSFMLDFFAEHVWNIKQADLTIYLKGISHTKLHTDRFEGESNEFYARVLDMYEARQNDTWRIFYSEENFDLIQGMIQEEILYFVNKHTNNSSSFAIK